MQLLEKMPMHSLEEALSEEALSQAIFALESGKVLHFPNLAFDLQPEESSFLAPEIVDPRSKNISYDPKSDGLRGTVCQDEQAMLLKAMMQRYALFSRQLIERVLPAYLSHLVQARTSFRPVEANGRITSYRKDDTRLHVDAFPSNPVNGKRILRVFTNVNPDGKPRVWRLGEPFADVASAFTPRLSPPLPGVRYILRTIKVTKTYRSLYDHYMLKLHDAMKADLQYQKIAMQQEVHFPVKSTWIVYSDQVSHAAMSGQHLFEQTFYLPPEALRHADKSPLKVLERLLERKLV